MADITKNIIFRIGSEMGEGGLASLKAGYDMFMQMSGAVVRHIAELEEFLDVQRNVQMDLSKVETNVRALTGSMNLMTAANRLTQAGIKLTGEEFAAVAKNAAAFADAAGIKTSDALDRLVSGLITGNERGLRPFGLQLDDAKTKAEKTSEAIKQLTARAGELNPQLDTTSEKINGLADAWKRFVANMASQAGEINVISEAFTFWIETLNEYSDRVDQINRAQSFQKMADQLHALNVQQMAALKAGDLATYYKLQEQAGPLEVRAGLRGAEAPEEAFMEMGPTPDQLADIALNRSQKRGGGGGRREAYKPIEAAQLATIGAIEIDNQAVQAQFDDTNAMMAKSLQDSLSLASNYKEAAYNRDVELYRTSEQQRLIEQQNMYAIEADAYHTHKITQLEMALGVDQRYVNESARIWRSGLQGKMATMGVFFNNVSQLMTVKSKALFAVGKAAAIAEGLVNTYLGAIKAYQSMCGLGPWGVALGIIAAAAVTAAGLANVNRIRAMEYGKDGGGGGSMGGSTSIGTGGGEGALPSSQPGGGGYNGPPQQQEQKVVIEINMGDSALFLDAVVDQNDKASQSGRRYFARAR